MKKSELNKMVNDYGYRDENGHKYKAKNMYIMMRIDDLYLVGYIGENITYEINKNRNIVYENPEYYDGMCDYKEYPIDYLSDDYIESLINNDWEVEKHNKKYYVRSLI